MQWSNSGAKNQRLSEAVLAKEIAEERVLEFVPTRFDLGTPVQALSYLTEKNKGVNFRMNEAIRIHTGVDQVEKASDEQKVEEAALEKLKEIQEAAYQEAYNLGLEEGRKKAFDKFSNSISERMESLDTLMTHLKEQKKEMATFNEAHLIQLVFHIGSRLAKMTLEGNQEAMIQILRDAVNLSQDEENIVVQVSPGQFEFLEELKKETGREFEFVKRIRFEPNEEVADGGCIVETNYGEVDARIEQRVSQLWTALAESLPKVKEKVAS